MEGVDNGDYKPDIKTYELSSYRSRRGTDPDGIIIHSMGHYIEGEFAGAFLNRLGLSAHYLITFTGTIYNCVETGNIAYHAGESEFNGETGLNETFIGIELLIPGDYDYELFLENIKKPEMFSEQHYKSCKLVCGWLMEKYDIPITRITRHSDVSGPDVRETNPKKDPGEGFDFDKLISMLEDDETV